MEGNMEPIRIFVGTSETEDKWIERVLVYTLLENTDRELEITMMRPSMFEDWNKTGWGTPFTCFRYAIPHLCDYKGKAIYMDCDQMNFRDIGEFYDTDLGDCAFGMVWDTLNMNPKEFAGTDKERGWFSDSMILMDCEKAAKWIGEVVKNLLNNCKVCVAWRDFPSEAVIHVASRDPPVLRLVAFGSFSVLKNLSWLVNFGEIRGVIGPNGAGKTTLARKLINEDKNIELSISVGQIYISFDFRKL